MPKLETYLVNGEAGKHGVAGAPLLHFSLVIDARSGDISGHAQITQAAVALPHGEKKIGRLSGHVRDVLLPPLNKLVSLKGVYFEPLPPPAIGTTEVPFEANFVLDAKWNGVGGFSCGTLNLNNVPVHMLG